ncbi:MAG: terminase small subunit [Ruminococcus sp.]|nr:terminase small subunit [Ruminococcus sp.]
MQEPKLKPQLKLVAKYYVGQACGNAEKAAIMAGYSHSYARGNAYKLVGRQDVQEYIKYLNARSEKDPENHVATTTEIQAFWTDIMKDSDSPNKDRLRASELLAKAKGMFRNEW